jgi:hypothetical protein
MSERCETWKPIRHIEFPCADISFARGGNGVVRALMHFSRVRNGASQDLELLFSGTIGLRWAPEHFAFTASLPILSKPLPKIAGGQWSGWTFPLLNVFESPWLASYQGLPGTERRQHFWLVAMNDEVHIIALPEVTARWITPE